MKTNNDYAMFRRKLIAAGYEPLSQEPFLQGYLALQDLKENASQVSTLLFDGEPGAGKTYFAECVAKMLGAKLLRYQLTPNAGAEQLLYDLHFLRIIQGMAGVDVPKSPQDLFSSGILVQAFQESLHGPTLLLLDEFDKALPEVDSFLLGCLQDKAIHDPHIGSQPCDPANLLVIITKNDQRTLSNALMRRTRRVYLGFPHPDQECALLLKHIPTFPLQEARTLISLANKLRAQKEKALKVPSTPELIRCANDLLVAPAEVAGSVVEQWLVAFPQDRSLLKQSTAELAGLFKYASGR
ncbi:hypothetical protein KSF_107600 [Reticulibacter mediterranei]|uniref:AAA+ ATPase domain-containing protein n=1 Tax=Reticulibacter mediterranei TaxID=2778369 RepID=A0A8J3NAS7_9CHLR|nr:MoxR family ATPase [Reticulibacter mediterranei]GHP00713.1 hypothetical protein KSF_107600 [Reticulibacter mediterranei]